MDKEATFGTVEAVKTVSELFMPVSGTAQSPSGVRAGSLESVGL